MAESVEDVNPVARRRILADTWYAGMLKDVCVSFDQLLRDTYPGWAVRLVNRSSLLRGLFLFWLGRSYSLIVTGYRHPGMEVATVLEALFHRGSRRVVLLEFFRRKAARSRRKQFLHSALWGLVLKPSIQRAMAAAHVLTDWEREHYARMIGVEVDRLFYIPWPLRGRSDQFAPAKPSAGAPMVLSSGRSMCDWETLFEAFEGASWPLTVICDKRDLPRIEELNHNNRARILSEIPFQEHEREMRDAAVYVLCLAEQEISSGHVRLSDATRAGTPVVASKVRGLESYVADGETGLLVEPGNPAALRAAIERLLGDPPLSSRLAKEAFERAGEHTTDEYREQIRALILGCVDCPSHSK